MSEFTVIVPAWNEAKNLPATLSAIGRQTCMPKEVIVVDNLSTDDTSAVAKAWGATVLLCEKKGVAHARQMGLEHATTQWIATTDADSLPVPSWLAAYNTQTSGRVALYGPMRFFGLQEPYPMLSQAFYNGFLYLTHKAGRVNMGGANMAYSRSAALLAGGYPFIEAREDIVLGKELCKIGRVAYISSALVETSARRLENGVIPFLWRHWLNVHGHTKGYFEYTRE